MPQLQLSRTEGTSMSVRMEPLAKLPVFWSLAGKRVVLAGGSDAAAWKAELLCACGADVHVYAPQADLSLTFAALLVQTPAEGAGRVIHHDRPWATDIMQGSALAIADCEDDAEAKAFFCAAVIAGIPVNVIDKPAFCQFQFGSIVNRSPVVVAISTDGAAPILAQAIRRRIETLLPPTLKGWAALAQSLRETVNRRLQPGAPRRAFWESFVDRAFAGSNAPQASAADDLLCATEAMAGSRTTGRVTLVGAGPGDAEYLTLKAVRALQAADVILFDDLVSGEVLELARREAKRMLVGKRGGRESCRQEDINSMMIDLARAGKHVVRLKSGDPMVFGRAGEEIAILREHHIAVDVVPGITAASAMAARLRVSLTHRDHAQAVRFVTGHARDGKLPKTLDWRSLADPTTTTVFYMAGRTAGEICHHLLAEGMSEATPAVIVSSVARSSERRWSGSLDELHVGIAEIGYDEPVLIGIGGVFATAAANYEDTHRESSLKSWLHSRSAMLP
ncbi:MAG: siroheme synthase CysG [Pseudorhizobium pelagicum]|uniref:siroheme synthase CysG n=1 Tax=Pseudorhizobium pelagicum TaxID=1509405 RepID=UPI003B6033E3